VPGYDRDRAAVLVIAVHPADQAAAIARVRYLLGGEKTPP
jgi:hypothetical protein